MPRAISDREFPFTIIFCFKTTKAKKIQNKIVLFINQPKSSISLLVSVKSEKAILSLKSDMSYTSIDKKF